MSEPVQIAVIAGLCAAVPPIIVSIINRHHVSSKIEAVHVQINSRMDEWMKAQKSISHAEGMADQRQIDSK